MRAFVSRWTWAGAVVVGLGLFSFAGCRSGSGWGMPGSSWTAWGKKDATSLAAAKPSSNFPTPPSKTATPNSAATAAASSGARPNNPAGPSNAANANAAYPMSPQRPNNPAGPSNAANANAAYPMSPQGNSGAGARPGGVAQTGGYNTPAHSTGSPGNNGAAGGQGDHGFYSSTPPGSNTPPSKWGGSNPGYTPGNTAIPRSGYDFQTADRRGGEFGAADNASGDNPYASGEFGAAGRAAAEPPGSFQRNPYAPPAGNVPSSARPPAYGPAGHDDHHGHSHDDAGFAPSDSYGSPSKRPSSYEGGNDGYSPPGGAPAYRGPSGGYPSGGSSSGGYPNGGASMGSRSASLNASGLSKGGSGYLPGSTRRSIGGPSASTLSKSDELEGTSDVKPVAYNNADVPDDDASYSPSEPVSGGAFAEPGDSYPASPASRIGSAPGGAGFKR